MTIVPLMKIGIGGKLSGPSNPVTLPGSTQAASYTAIAPIETIAYAGWRFNRDGTVDRLQSESAGDWNYSHDWCATPSATVGDSFEIRKFFGSWDTTTITTSYQTLSSSYYMRDGSSGDPDSDSASSSITIREIADTSNADTQTYTSTTEVTSV
jgi:hypothetical protein